MIECRNESCPNTQVTLPAILTAEFLTAVFLMAGVIWRVFGGGRNVIYDS